MRVFRLLWSVSKLSPININLLKYSTWKVTRRTKSRNLVIMKLDTPEFRQIFTPELKKMSSVFDKYGYELRIAGGAVRDLLLNILPHDIDFASTATPCEMKEMFEREQIRMLNTKGAGHGTVTARINDKENFEVTTLRIDVMTDGRHAKVEFTKDWELDASRRDLTINALFLSLDGTLYDYFNGQQDLKQQRLRFVGNAADRIQEDYLRILRYFRFYGRMAREADIHEAETVEAIVSNRDGLSGMSGERIWSELKKIAVGRYNCAVVKKMLTLGLAPFIGLPSQLNVEEFERVCGCTTHTDPMPVTIISALLKTEEQVNVMNRRLRLSNNEVNVALFIVRQRGDEIGSDGGMSYCMDLYNDHVNKDPKIHVRIAELLKYRGQEPVLREFQSWTPPKFPVSGFDLFAFGVPKGPAFARMLHGLRQVWKESRYMMGKDELMGRIDGLLEEGKIKKQAVGSNKER